MDVTTPKGRQEFYQSHVWRELRKFHLRKEPLCMDCLTEDKVTAGWAVDHVISIKDAPHLRLSGKNLRTLCRSHHSKKTMIELKRANEGVGRLLNNTWKIDVSKFRR